LEASTPAYTAETTRRLSAEFLIPVNWPPYLSDLNSLDFSICSVLQVKVQAIPHPNLAALHPSIAAEWDRLAVVYFRKTCSSLDCRLEAIVVKNIAFIE
jgi:hypothetical protein